MKFLRPAAHLASMIALLALSIAVLSAQRSQPPAPSGREEKSSNPDQRSGTAQSQTQDLRGAEKLPAVVRVLPKSQEEAAQEQAESQRRATSDWWTTIVLGGLTILVMVGQLVVYKIQANKLGDTIEKMDSVAKGQTEDMGRYIAQATRSADSMECVARTLAESTAAVQKSLLITQGIADTQRFVFELANRAWLVVTFDGMEPQDNARNLHFAPRVNIVNRGNTPAYKVTVLAAADVLPFPLPRDFAFPLPGPAPGSGISVIGPGLLKSVKAMVPRMHPDDVVHQVRSGDGQRIVMWGLITYTDTFDKDRFVKFSYTHFNIAEGQWFSLDTGLYSDSD